PVSSPARGEAGGAGAVARGGLPGGASPLPHLDRIQTLFGDHDLTNVRAFNGGPAAPPARALSARAYAVRGALAFRETPHPPAAVEAAHGVQQRRGIHVPGGLGEAGDAHERQADAIADRVAGGHAVGGLLGPASRAAAGVPASAPVQREIIGKKGDEKKLPDA